MKKNQKYIKMKNYQINEDDENGEDQNSNND
jgi:hypothetical protein